MNIIENDKLLVSIIVVTYNSSEYVIETLESIKSQTYQKIELIVADDCSKDNTLEICKNWIERNKLRFTSTELIKIKKNTGTSSNINRGMAAAKGSYIKTIAGDDILLNNCVEESLDFAVKHKASFIFSDMIYFRKNQFGQYEDIEHHVNIKLQPLYSKFSNLDYQGQRIFYSRDTIFLNSPTWFYAKNKIPRFDEDFRIVEDGAFIFRYLKTKEKINYMNKTTVRYRRYEQSTDQNKYFSFISDFIDCFSKYRKENLKKTSIVDIMFMFNFFIKFNLELWSRKNMVNRVIAYPIKKLNPVILLNISPFIGLSRFKNKEVTNESKE